MGKREKGKRSALGLVPLQTADGWRLTALKCALRGILS